MRSGEINNTQRTRLNVGRRADKQAAIRTALLEPGATHRSVARLLGVHPATVYSAARTMELPLCPCGKTFGHQGWCKWRYSKSEARQAWQASRSRISRAEASVRYDPQLCNNFCFQFETGSNGQPMCSWPGCAFTVEKNGEECIYHRDIFFAYPISLTDLCITPDLYMIDEEHPNDKPPLSLVYDDKFDESKFTILEESRGWRVRKERSSGRYSGGRFSPRS
jgi:hypothetical protein